MPGGPVLFLDIDGVLCLDQPACSYSAWDVWEEIGSTEPPREEIIRGAFHGPSVDALKEIARRTSDLELVISSSWRHTFERAQIAQIFAIAGLDGLAARMSANEKRWCTPRHLVGATRLDDICTWMKSFHRTEPFAVIDDPASGASLACAAQRSFWRDRIFLCEQGAGLPASAIQGVCSALGRPSKTCR